MGAAPQGSGEGNDVAIMARARTRASSALFEVKLCEGTADNRNTNVLYLQGYCTKNPAKTHLQDARSKRLGFLMRNGEPMESRPRRITGVAFSNSPPNLTDPRRFAFATC